MQKYIIWVKSNIFSNKISFGFLSQKKKKTILTSNDFM